MTPKFDEFVNQIITESRCKGLTGRQLSDKASFRWMQCVENPYSHGFKRIYFGDKRRKFDLAKCTRDPRPGTSTYADCQLAIRALRRKARLKRIARLKKKLADK